MRSIVGSSFAAELTEEQAALRVFLAAGGLVVLGVALLCMTVWWWRSTRPEPPALGPLEVMSDKRWRTAGESERRRIVEEFRPEGAVAARDASVAPVPVDLSVLARDVPNFDDLRDVSLDGSLDSPVPSLAGDPEALELVAETSPAADPDAADLDAAVLAEVDVSSSEHDPGDADVDVDVADADADVADADADADADAGAAIAAAAMSDGVAGRLDGSMPDEVGSADPTVAEPRPFDVGQGVARD